MSDTETTSATRTASLKMSIAGRPIEMQVNVPVGPTKPRQIVPLLQWLTNEVVDIACQQVAAEGKAISCRAGCGACCRQLVPISPAEAYRIAELIERLPEPRRTDIRRRFEQVRERLAAAGFLERLCDATSVGEGSLHATGIEYFRLGIPCPFLEDESCSIHAERPLSCREYLVTSPAEHCRQPTAQTVEKVMLPVKISSALLRLERGASEGPMPWVPLSLAPEWVEQHPELPPRHTGPALMDEVFSRIRGLT
ncbi:MAG TPA: YkgJ family cysteine cluster protein [Pirellulales bacterium]|nr:YkgJ family cysteine cluster protein [Pirellulales bacterium]